MNAPTITKEISIKSGIEELGIFEKHNDAWVSSRNIAKLFGKEHFHVIRDIEEKVIPFVSEEFTQSNIGVSKYKDKSGKSNPQYLLNRKSFTGDNTVNVKINTLQEAIDKIKVTLTGPDKDFLIRRLP